MRRDGGGGLSRRCPHDRLLCGYDAEGRHQNHGDPAERRTDQILLQRSYLEETLSPIRAERAKWEADLDAVYDILQAGTAKAQAITNATLARVEKAMRIDYFADRRIVKEWEKQLKAAKL